MQKKRRFKHSVIFLRIFFWKLSNLQTYWHTIRLFGEVVNGSLAELTEKSVPP